ncbi:MAG: hypothetical protein PVH03_06840 [Chloroflexota bacterium]|jgi:hypothetical protein
MNKFLAIIILAMFSLWGCAPVIDITATPLEETESNATELALTEADETALEQVDPQELEGETMLVEPNPVQTRQDNVEELTSQAVTAIAPAGEIDLGDISQDQGAEEEEGLIELPAPGVPNTSTLPIETAKIDLAKRLDIKVDDISLVSVEPEIWSDSSLGCPAPGINYLMVLVKGFRITLEGDGEKYTYHTDTDDQVILCEDGQPADS